MFKRKGIDAALALVVCQLISTSIHAQCLCCTPFFLELGTGASFSQKPRLSVDLNNFDVAPEGYENRLSDTALYMAGIGYNICPLLSVDINATHRGQYDYRKFQTGTTGPTPNPLGDKIRYFRLYSNAVMLNMTLNGRGVSHNLEWHTGCCSFIQPFIGAGLGVAYNTLTDFHTKLPNTNATADTIPDRTKTSFAYQFNAGLEWQCKRLAIGVGYRYFDGNRFETNHYFATRTNAAGDPIRPSGTVTPWRGRLKANEAFITAKVSF